MSLRLTFYHTALFLFPKFISVLWYGIKHALNVHAPLNLELDKSTVCCYYTVNKDFRYFWK